MSSGRMALLPAAMLRVKNCEIALRPNGAPLEPRNVGKIVKEYCVAGRRTSAGWNVTVLPAESAAPETAATDVRLLTITLAATDAESIGISKTACGRNAAPGSSVAPLA